MDTNFEKYVSPNMLNLTDIYAVKVLISYFLYQINRPISPAQLTEIATGDGIVNYFFFMEAISSMLETNMVSLEEIDGSPKYVLQEKGRLCAIEFKSIVPQSFRDRIMTAGIQFFTRLKNENTVKIEIEEKNIGCMLHCTCNDANDVVLMKLSLFAPDTEQAELMKKRLMSNPTMFYSKVVDYLLENQELPPDLPQDRE